MGLGVCRCEVSADERFRTVEIDLTEADHDYLRGLPGPQPVESWHAMADDVVHLFRRLPNLRGLIVRVPDGETGLAFAHFASNLAARMIAHNVGGEIRELECTSTTSALLQACPCVTRLKIRASTALESTWARLFEVPRTLLRSLEVEIVKGSESGGNPATYTVNAAAVSSKYPRFRSFLKNVLTFVSDLASKVPWLEELIVAGPVGADLLRPVK